MDVLGSFVFVRAPEGGYHVSWSYPQSPVSCSLIQSVSRPRKLIDLKGPMDGLVNDLRFEMLEAGLANAVDFIPMPVVQAAVATAISRLAHYFKMTEIEHVEMLHELVIDPVDPLLHQLSHEQREAVIKAYEYSSTVGGDGWEWILSSTGAVWDKELKSEAKNAALSLSWLRGHDEEVTEINSRFSCATDTENFKRLYLVAQQAPSKRVSPIVSIEYADPNRVVAERVFMEMVDIGVEFASHMVPKAGSLVTMAYNWLVQNRINATQYWEARLTQHLETRADQHNWDNELLILERQRINPLEINRSQMNRLIEERKKLIGL